MKHIISLTLCIILITLNTFSVFATPTGKTISTNDSEILRAISYGSVPDKLQGDWDKTITFSQFCTMLKNMLSLYDKRLVSKWGKVSFTSVGI